ncbi:MAG: AAA family ATPase [Anaerolineae bacterium]|nr:AAA family ATPase [Anaerolineae bacterium]
MALLPGRVYFICDLRLYFSTPIFEATELDILDPEQYTLLMSPRVKVFVEGPPGSGKTTLAVERLRYLVGRGMPPTAILVLLPQRLLAGPYYQALRDPALGPAGAVDILTFDGLARRIIRLFWPLIGARAGFAHPTRPPIFLTVETAQYFMEHIVAPLIERERYFEAITIERGRLLSQLLDNLNKAALTGIPLSEVAERLKGAWAGEAAQRRVFDQVGVCVQRFRQYCLAHNLLDFSLQIDTFVQHLYPQPAVQAYLFERYRHLIVDNLEEDTPVVHDLLREWVRHCESAFLVYDQSGGHRVFLGADPRSAARLAEACGQRWEMARPLVAPADVLHLAYHIGLSLNRKDAATLLRQMDAPTAPDFRRILHTPGEQECRFHPQMLDWVVEQIEHLIRDEGVSPGEIVVLAPFVGDALRFSLLERLAARAIPARSHRPSRALWDEPAARCLLTLMQLAHPHWQLPPPKFDVMLALMQALAGLDLVRAWLLTEVVYRPHQTPWLGSFQQVQGDTRARITPALGERYERLRAWLLDHPQSVAEDEAVDHFLTRLFGEILSQHGFGFHHDDAVPSPAASSALDKARIAAQLIESARKFRQALEMVPGLCDATPIGARFIQMVQRRLLAATYLPSEPTATQNAVLLSPAYSFLMTNRFVDYQFWLDIGDMGWWERIYQPLTHPYVLRRDWEAGRPWNDADEFNARQETLYRLVVGLAYRCRRGIYVGISDLSEQGYEQQGPLLRALQAALRRMR